MATLLDPVSVPIPGAARDPGVRASPAQIRDPRPQVLESFANSLNVLSGTFQALQEKRQGAEDGAFVDDFQLAYNQRAAEIEADALNSPEINSPDFVKTLDARLEEAQRQSLDEVMQAKGYNPTQAGRDKAAHAAMNIRLGAARNAVAQTHNQRVSLLVDTANENVISIAKAVGGSGDVAGGIERANDVADRLTGVLAPDKLKAFRDAAHSTVTTMAVEGHLARKEYDQAQEIIDRETGFAAPTADDPAREIIAAAKAGGVDPAVALAIAQTESELAPAAKAGLPTLTYPSGPGLVEKGNIDLNRRPTVQMGDKIATLRSVSRNIDGVEVLVPTVTDDGRIVSDDEAFAIYERTGKFLGKFKSAAEATAYAKRLSADQGTRYGVEPASSAGGLFQITEATGRSLNLPGDASEMSVPDQAKVGVTLIASNTAVLRRALHGEPTPAEILLAHVLGAGDAIRVLRADAETKATDLLSKDVIAANKQFANLDAAGLLGWAKRKMQGGMEATAGSLDGRSITPDAAGLPLSKAVELSKRVASARGQNNSELIARIKDDVASIKATGQPVGIDPEEAGAVLTDTQFNNWVNDREDAGTYWDATHDMNTIPADEITGRVEALAPKPGEVGFDRRQTLYEDVAKEGKRLVKLRADDPVLSVVDVPEVKKAATEFDSNDSRASWGNLFKARQTAQAQIGIPEELRMVLTKDEVRRLAAPLIHSPQDEWFTRFDQMASGFEEQFGLYADDVLQQVVEELVKDKDHATYATRVIRNIINRQPVSQEDARAVDTAVENQRIDEAARLLGDVMGNEEATRQSIGAALNPPRLYPKADQSAVLYLKANPNTLPDFISLYGEDQVPLDMRPKTYPRGGEPRAK